MDVLKSITHSILFCLLIVNLSTASASSNAPEIPNDGVWTSKCKKSDKFYYQTEIEVIDDVWTETKAYYKDSLCIRTRHFEISKMFQYKLNESKVDFTALMSWVRPITNNSIAYLKSLQQCQNKSWARGKRIEVTGENCLNDIFPKEQSNLYNLMTFEGERKTLLWLGEFNSDFDGSIPEKRPTQFQQDALIKVN